MIAVGHLAIVIKYDRMAVVGIERAFDVPDEVIGVVKTESALQHIESGQRKVKGYEMLVLYGTHKRRGIPHLVAALITALLEGELTKLYYRRTHLRIIACPPSL